MAVVVAGFSLYPVRLLLLIALVRIIAKRQFPLSDLNKIDRVVILLYVYIITVFLIRSNEDVVYAIGTGVDALLSYFVFRALFRTIDDVKWFLYGLVALLVPYVVLLWIETTTTQNLFAAVGGVELALGGDIWFRDGRLRATGSFGHPSLLGTFGGTFLAIYIGLWFTRSNRVAALLGSVMCLAIVGASNSGGPAVCVVVAIVAWLLWPLRDSMQWVRLALVVTIIVLAMVMKAPVWYLMARISSIFGGDGSHRAELLSVSFYFFEKWWLAGMPLSQTAGWLPYNNSTTGYVDMTNTFLLFGVNAGVGAVGLLVALLYVTYSQLGIAMGEVRKQKPPIVGIEQIYWGLGSLLTIHIFTWFSITYWDQMNSVFFLHLAIISSLTGNVILHAREQETTVNTGHAVEWR